MSSCSRLLSVTSLVAIAAGLSCTAEDDCLSTPATPRCLSVPKGQGAPCVLDYGYNSTGYCACGSQSCVPLTVANHTSKKQWLMIGDSISLGQEGAAQAAALDWEIVHAPSFTSGSNNNDNAHWHDMCAEQWLGPDVSRWDAITINAGAHDLAFPDNEHISASSYAVFVERVLRMLLSKVKQSAVVVWARITPVPTDPPPQCVLIPGRLEVDVARYNEAADNVVSTIRNGNPASALSSCDLHKVITDVCGATYATCNITQCAGPHFSAEGFALLGNKTAACVALASKERTI